VVDQKQQFCPYTGLEIQELKEFSHIQGESDYFYSIKKIGDSILYLTNSGDMSLYDVKTQYDLVDRFITKAQMKKPIVEIRDFSQLTGRTRIDQLRSLQKYYKDNEEDYFGIILCGAPVWLGGLARAAYKTTNILTQFLIAGNYKKAITSALALTEKKLQYRKI
jgi:hypothetical protein